jgi:DNA polymerase IV
MQKVIFHIDMDAFFASCEEAINPELKKKPLIVGGNKEDKRGIVACPNYLARAKGVKTAMPITRALILVPEANFIRSTKGLYSGMSKKVREIFYKYTPIVQPVSIDEAYLDVTGVLHEYKNDPVILAEKIKNEIKKSLKITCSIGIASNKVCAKIGSKMNKPDGITIVPFGKEKEFLSELPVESIPGVGNSTQARLKKYGINLIGDILKYDKSFFENEIGIHTSYLFYVADGTYQSEVHEYDYDDRKSLSKENTFYEDTLDRIFLKAELYYLIERCCMKLRELKIRSRNITVKVKYFDFKVNQKSYTCHKYSNLEIDFYNDAERLMEQLLSKGKKIRLLGVRFAELTNEDHYTQENLFSDLDRFHNLSEKIDKIRKKYKYDVVKFGKTMGV